MPSSPRRRRGGTSAALGGRSAARRRRTTLSDVTSNACESGRRARGRMYRTRRTREACWRRTSRRRVTPSRARLCSCARVERSIDSIVSHSHSPGEASSSLVATRRRDDTRCTFASGVRRTNSATRTRDARPSRPSDDVEAWCARDDVQGMGKQSVMREGRLLRSARVRVWHLGRGARHRSARLSGVDARGAFSCWRLERCIASRIDPRGTTSRLRGGRRVARAPSSSH